MSQKFVLGFTTRNGVLLDYDQVGLEKVDREAGLLSSGHGLGHFLVVRSKRASYHVVFEREVGYAKACRIIDESSAWSQQNEVLRARRGDTTLRISPKKGRGFPVPLYLRYPGDDAVPAKEINHWPGLTAEYMDCLRLAHSLYSTQASTCPSKPNEHSGGAKTARPTRGTTTSRNSRPSSAASESRPTPGHAPRRTTTRANTSSESRGLEKTTSSRLQSALSDLLSPVWTSSRSASGVTYSTALKTNARTTLWSSTRPTASGTSRRTGHSTESPAGLTWTTSTASSSSEPTLTTAPSKSRTSTATLSTFLNQLFAAWRHSFGTSRREGYPKN